MLLNLKSFRRCLYLILLLLLFDSGLDPLLADSIPLPDQNPGNDQPTKRGSPASPSTANRDEIFRILREEQGKALQFFGDEFGKTLQEMESFFNSPRGGTMLKEHGFDQLFEQLNRQMGGAVDRGGQWRDLGDHWELRVGVDRTRYDKIDVKVTERDVKITGEGSATSRGGNFSKKLSLPANTLFDQAKVSHQEQEVIITIPKQIIAPASKKSPPIRKQPSMPKRVPLRVDGITI
jgi:HSP20 family molecular chaperone IbpA